MMMKAMIQIQMIDKVKIKILKKIKKVINMIKPKKEK
jgi:hypothetical protein